MKTSYKLTKKEAKEALKRLYKLDSSCVFQGEICLVGNTLTARYVDDSLEVTTDYFVDSTIKDCIIPSYRAYISSIGFTLHFDTVDAFTKESALKSIKMRNKGAWRDCTIWVERINQSK